MSGIIGRIYKITSSETDSVYIGSTTLQLNARFDLHKSHYRRYLNGKFSYMSSFEICKYAAAKIELIHEGLFNDRHDIEKYEGNTIRTTPNCVNKYVVGRTQKEYREANKNQISERKKEYYESNKETIKAYYESNKDSINEKRKQKHTCPICNGKFTTASKSVHEKTNKHLNAISSSSSQTSETDLESESE